MTEGCGHVEHRNTEFAGRTVSTSKPTPFERRGRGKNSVVVDQRRTQWGAPERTSSDDTRRPARERKPGGRFIAVPARARAALPSRHGASNQPTARCECFAFALKRFSPRSGAVHMARRRPTFRYALARRLDLPGIVAPHAAAFAERQTALRCAVPTSAVVAGANGAAPAVTDGGNAARRPATKQRPRPVPQHAAGGDGDPFRGSFSASAGSRGPISTRPPDIRRSEGGASRDWSPYGALLERRMMSFWMWRFNGRNMSRCPSVNEHAKGFA